MIALPSIAYDSFAGTAKEVTARKVGGRTVLSSRATQPAFFTPAQAVSRNRLAKISRAFRNLTDQEMARWEQLARQYNASSSLGKGAEFTAHNIFVRLNCNLAMLGSSPITEAPIGMDQVPPVSLDTLTVNSFCIELEGVDEPDDRYRLVVKMSDGQSVGVSSAWTKTVVVSSSEETDWGDLDLTQAFANVLGHKVENGKKYFIELYWVDPETGFAGPVTRLSGIAGWTPICGIEGGVERSRVKVKSTETYSGNHVKDFNYELTPRALACTCKGHFDYLNEINSIQISMFENEEAPFVPHQSFLLGRGSNGGDWTIGFLHVKIKVSDMKVRSELEVTYDDKAHGLEVFDTGALFDF